MATKKKPVVDGMELAMLSACRKDLFFAAMQASHSAMIVTDPAGPDNPIIFANQAFLTLTGFELDEVIGRNCRFLQGPQTDKNALHQVQRAVEQHHEACVEVLNYRKDGSTFWNELFISPLFNERGQLVYFFASQLDVSRRHDAEQRVRRAQDLEALGQLTGGIAHDFNNLLQVMMGYLDLIQQSAKRPGSDLQRIVNSANRARAAGEKAQNLTQQLLAFSRKQRLDSRVINLNSLLSRPEFMAHALQGVELHVELAEDLWNCRIDPVQAELAVQHLLSNAQDALHGRADPAVTVKTCNVQVPGDADAERDGLVEGRYVSISVSDNGNGIDAGIQDKVMQPFFTTKEEGQGSGLGLSMVYGFVKQSGGTARIHSDPGIGTTIRLYFPADDSQLWVEQAPEATSPQGNERILIVEDRPEVAELAQVILSDYGYHTDIALNAAEALGMLRQATYDLVFSDLIMPGAMNGAALAREVSRLYPHIRVLLTTGYAKDSLARADIEVHEFELISKPYQPAELPRKIRAVLDA
ncbi:hybrid sensor histidine kinase/response regulator [Pseudomonas sp. GL93]|uniref:histidine kinase famiy protein n=1 Tax=Pseudomonas sp. GL93 TaxID=2014741 RepID=UPI000E30F5B0|nr:histidine kinase famiy protein [Pseudomonas sp. GL93]RFD25119.1 hybrid sensor histidine kinase/response regulator [Pseudomonas sp. GL93]